MLVEVLDETGRFRSRDRLEGVLAALGRELGVGAEREVTVVLLDDDRIAERNAADRGVAGPTDVLAYPTREPDDVGMPEVASLGDVLISLETAERQAAAHGHDGDDEVLVLAAHALVHLLGFDHVDDADWRPFHRAQERVLAIAHGGGGHG